MEELSDSDFSVEILSTLSIYNNTLLTYLLYKNYQNVRKKRFWVREIFRKRQEQGFQANLVRELRQLDPQKHFQYFRMNRMEFDEILELIRPLIYKPDSRFRRSVSPEEKLSLTLRYLASGDLQISLSFAYRLGASTVCNIIKETCQALWNVLSPIYLRMPQTSEEWLQISETFENMWNLPHCVGALDGKHIAIQCPAKSGSKYFNYKGNFSIVLLALCDANYKFTMVDVGGYGSESDGGVFARSNFGCKLNSGFLSLPQPSELPNSNLVFQYFIAAGEAFPLNKNIMRPYPRRGLSLSQRIFNYRLCRARRVIENTFGIFAARWQIFHRTIKGKPENIDEIIKATVCLHNFIITKEALKNEAQKMYIPSSNYVDREGIDGKIIPGQWRKEMGPENPLSPCRNLFHVNRHPVNVGQMRDTLSTYLCNEGKVSWQIERVTRGST